MKPIIMLCLIKYLNLLLFTLPPLVKSFSSIIISHPTTTTFQTQHHTSTSTTILYATYGKGSEIWPATNEEPILLSSSFPGGVIPQSAINLLESSSSSTDVAISSNNNHTDTSSSQSSSSAALIDDTTTKGRKRRAVRATLSHILRSASSASSRRARSTETIENEYADTYGIPHHGNVPAISKGPAILAFALLITNCVNIQHLISVIAMSIYFIGLASWCTATKSSSSQYSIAPVNMPSLPEKGHVPALITNPLGALTNSRSYRIWLRVGALLGLLLPSIILTQLTLGSKFPRIMTNLGNNVGEIKRIIGGPMFLLCSQALTEALARTALLPLPLRILIPVSYNTLRLSSLQSWSFSSRVATPLQILGMINLLYWYANLFGFLIPVGVVRYLRAHFFCVEAVEVTVRKGGEDSVGLL